MGDALWAIPLGFLVGAYGTLIGAGGGFVLMPVLLVLYPGQSPELLTSISLAVVFFNAASGSWAYARVEADRLSLRTALLGRHGPWRDLRGSDHRLSPSKAF